ncbi:MAG TPA: hypothetical protein DCZ69_18285 [Syntrophobacteraceae bacterium]|nr:hypothetical protein [Syntrophobacteraceae bacterium]HBD10206.1 hypothetical protein [Syntrophobacteraceae bacterium]HBZ57086.1 hypothetical protein [Syntrophobacteraceae bacterium]
MSESFEYPDPGYRQISGRKEGRELWHLQGSEMEDDVYCSNSACDLNIPTRQVFADPFAKRMRWKAKDGRTKHFCETCARAVATWWAESQ